MGAGAAGQRAALFLFDYFYLPVCVCASLWLVAYSARVCISFYILFFLHRHILIYPLHHYAVTFINIHTSSTSPIISPLIISMYISPLHPLFLVTYIRIGFRWNFSPLSLLISCISSHTRPIYVSSIFTPLPLELRITTIESMQVDYNHLYPFFLLPQCRPWFLNASRLRKSS